MTDPTEAEWSAGALAFAVSTMIDAGLMDRFVINLRGHCDRRMRHPDWLKPVTVGDMLANIVDTATEPRPDPGGDP